MKKAIFSLSCFLVFFGFIYGQVVDSTGTGFFITDSGIIVTCAHVIEGANRVTVLIDNQEYPAEIMGKNNNTDIAILRINYKNPFHFKLTDFSTVRLGDKLSVLGYPLSYILGSDIRFTEGSVSALNGIKSDPINFQHSAPTQPGNSGGPILNSRMEVIGINAAVINDTMVKNNTGTNPQNINFGVKTGYIIPVLNNIRPGSGNVRTISDAVKATVQVLCYHAREQNLISITVINRTGYTGWYLYISPSSSDTWGPDRLGEGTLSNGRSFTLRDLPFSADNRYDLRLVDEDEDSYTKWNVQIRQNQNIEFTFDDFDSQTSAAGNSANNTPVINIVNNTGYTVYYVYISPSSSDRWGEDRLRSDQVLNNGDSVQVRLEEPLRVVNKYDIRLKDEDGDTYSKYNVTVTANGRIVFTMSDFD